MIYCEISILSYSDIPLSILHLIVFENQTTGNVGSNGETEFHHVMMKCIVDANGAGYFEFTERDPGLYQYLDDLGDTNIEEWDDLGLAIIIQDYETKEIYQSAYSIEDFEYSTNNNLVDLTVDGVSISGFDPEILNYTVILPENTSIVPKVIGIPELDIERAIVIPTTELPGTTTIDVYAENLLSHKQYTIQFLLSTGSNQLANPSFEVFPNPSNGIFEIKGAEGSKIKVTDLSGNTVFTVNELTGNSMNLSMLKNGIYVISSEQKNKTTLKKRITILK